MHEAQRGTLPMTESGFVKLNLLLFACATASTVILTAMTRLCDRHLQTVPPRAVSVMFPT